LLVGCVKSLVALVVVVIVLWFTAGVYLYKIKDEGTLYLDGARGVASITRESET